MYNSICIVELYDNIYFFIFRELIFIHKPKPSHNCGDQVTQLTLPHQLQCLPCTKIIVLVINDTVKNLKEYFLTNYLQHLYKQCLPTTMPVCL